MSNGAIFLDSFGNGRNIVSLSCKCVVMMLEVEKSENNR